MGLPKNNMNVKLTCPSCNQDQDKKASSIFLTRYIGGSAMYSFICTAENGFCGEMAVRASKQITSLLVDAGANVITYERPIEVDDPIRYTELQPVSYDDVLTFALNIESTDEEDLFDELDSKSIN
jgi:hypothetical protein